MKPWKWCKVFPNFLSRIEEEFGHVVLKDLRFITTLGVGGFGRVELVTLASDPSRSFALKQMKKSQVKC
jgi:cGMP-dependent protein kinase